MNDRPRVLELDRRAHPFFNAPYQPDPDLISRTSLQNDIQNAVTGEQPILLCGQAGTGKTHAAVHLAYDFCKQANHNNGDGFVLWIEARTAHSILSSFNQIALQLDLPVVDEPRNNACELVAEWLHGQIVRNTSKISTSAQSTTTSPFIGQRYLIILDGLENIDLLNEPLQPEAKFLKYSKPTQKYKALRSYLLLDRIQHSKLLITTRSQNIAETLCARSIFVSGFTEDEAATMFNSIAKDHVAGDVGTTLANRLSTNPLIVRMAAAYLQYTGEELQEYTRKVEQSIEKSSNASSSSSFPPEFRQDANVSHRPNVLVAVIGETIKMLLAKYNSLTEEDETNALDRLCLAVGLGGHHVPLWDFTKSPDCADVSDEGPALQTLIALGFINRFQPGFFTVSEVVQQGFWICAGPLCTPAMTDSQTAMATFFKQQINKGRGKGQAFIPLTEIALSHPESKSESLADILTNRADHYLSLNFYAEAWRDASLAYTINQSMHGEDLSSRDMLSSFHRLGQVMNNIGDFEMAEQIHRQALQAVSGLADAAPLRLECATDLAMTLSRQDKHQEAADLYRKAISDYEQSEGETVRTLSHAASLGAELCHMGQLDEALEIQEKAYTKLVELSGEKSKAASDALGELIATLTKQQKWTEAIEKSRHLLELREANEGPDAFATLATVANLAHLLYETDDKAESYKLYRRSLDGYSDRIGPNHPQTKIVQQNFNTLFRERLVTV